MKAHEKIGIVGRSGCGKSTIFLLLLRLLELSKGSITVDGIDISKLNLTELRRHITTIPQEPVIFKGTLRENIDLFNTYTDEEVWNALDRVGLAKKFEKEDALRTAISEAGGNLSSGEKQLIVIARAILSKNKIVLLDEATSNLDAQAEERVLKSIRENFSECTVMTIAHRLETIIDSDRYYKVLKA